MAFNTTNPTPIICCYMYVTVLFIIGYYLLLDTIYYWILFIIGYYLLLDAIYYWILFIIGYYAADHDFALYRIFNIDYNKIIAIIETKKMESENAIAMFEERKQMTISSSPPRYRKQPKERITLIGGKKGKLFYFLQITC
jgi:hypothetical protein